jgi:drug/metabolite transporter (DMT)-like permease
MVTAFFVAARIVAGPVANLFQKQLAQRGAHPLFIIAATHAILSVLLLPLLLRTAPLALPAGFWTNMALCAVLAVGGNVLLVYALRSTDLSILGPINAYKAIVSLVLAVFLLGEVPTAAGLAGVLLILAGSYFVVERAPQQPQMNAYVRFFRTRGVQLRFAALVLSATEAVFLKRAMLHATPAATFLFWALLGVPVAGAALAVLLRGCLRREMALLARHRGSFVWLALTTGAMQAATLFTFNAMQVGYSLALFQLSTLISVFLGYRYFAEREIGRRLVGSAIMGAGAVLIVALGRGY